MNRYVDAEYVKAVMLNDRLMQGNAEFTLYAQQVETQVNALPSIDIVRCGECKYWDDRRNDAWWSEEGACDRTSRLGHATYRNHDDFCSYGERDKDTNVLNKQQTERSSE